MCLFDLAVPILSESKLILEDELKADITLEVLSFIIDFKGKDCFNKASLLVTDPILVDKFSLLKVKTSLVECLYCYDSATLSKILIYDKLIVFDFFISCEESVDKHTSLGV